MNILKIFFTATLFTAAIPWAATNTLTCSSNCEVISQPLDKLDCSNAISEGKEFLLDGHKVVLTISRNAPRIQNEIATLRRGLQSRQQTMIDCFNKHRDKQEFSNAILPFIKADFAIEKLSQTPNMPQHAQEMLIGEYELATKTLSKLSLK